MKHSLTIGDTSKIDHDQPVSVHWNFHKKVYSVKQKGVVVAWLDWVELSDVDFRVSESGRQRVLKEKRKNVHAHVNGWFHPRLAFAPLGFSRVSYNPYRSGDFLDQDGQPVTYSDYAVLATENGRAVMLAKPLGK